MKQRYHHLLLLGIYSFLHHGLQAQAPLNAAMEYAQLSRNPALAGIGVNDLQINQTYQFQNPNYLLPYRIAQTQIISRYHFNQTEKGFSVGALLRYEEAGENKLKRAQFLPVINFHQSLSEISNSYISFALMPGIIKTQFDWNSLPTTDRYQTIPFNPNSPQPQWVAPSSNTVLDISSGISFYCEPNEAIGYYLGLALYHFGQNSIRKNQSVIPIKREWVFNAGLKIEAPNFSLHCMGDLRFQGFNTQLSTGLIGGIPIHKNLLEQSTEIRLGGYFANGNALSPTIGLQTGAVQFGLIYTLITGAKSDLPLLSNPIEMDLSIQINCHNRKWAAEKTKCLRHL